MDGGTSCGGGILSPLFIFLFVVALQALEGFLEIAKTKRLRNPKVDQSRKEIKGLLKEAASLSTPSTFAQSAKLRRLAAAKEKELVKKQEEHKKGKIRFYVLCEKVLSVLKVLLYGAFVFRLWGVPVAIVPDHLLWPFGHVLSWKVGSASAATGQIMVGIIPWLGLTSCVSKVLWKKLQKAFFKY